MAGRPSVVTALTIEIEYDTTVSAGGCNRFEWKRYAECAEQFEAFLHARLVRHGFLHRILKNPGADRSWPEEDAAPGATTSWGHSAESRQLYPRPGAFEISVKFPRSFGLSRLPQPLPIFSKILSRRWPQVERLVQDLISFLVAAHCDKGGAGADFSDGALAQCIQRLARRVECNGVAPYGAFRYAGPEQEKFNAISKTWSSRAAAQKEANDCEKSRMHKASPHPRPPSCGGRPKLTRPSSAPNVCSRPPAHAQKLPQHSPSSPAAQHSVTGVRRGPLQRVASSPSKVRPASAPSSPPAPLQQRLQWTPYHAHGDVAVVSKGRRRIPQQHANPSHLNGGRACCAVEPATGKESGRGLLNLQASARKGGTTSPRRTEHTAKALRGLWAALAQAEELHACQGHELLAAKELLGALGGGLASGGLEAPARDEGTHEPSAETVPATAASPCASMPVRGSQGPAPRLAARSSKLASLRRAMAGKTTEHSREPSVQEKRPPSLREVRDCKKLQATCTGKEQKDNSEAGSKCHEEKHHEEKTKNNELPSKDQGNIEDVTLENVSKAAEDELKQRHMESETEAQQVKKDESRSSSKRVTIQEVVGTTDIEVHEDSPGGEVKCGRFEQPPGDAGSQSTPRSPAVATVAGAVAIFAHHFWHGQGEEKRTGKEKAGHEEPGMIHFEGDRGEEQERPVETCATDLKIKSSTQEVAGEDEKEKHRGDGQGQEERRVRESDDREEQGMADFENESSEEEVGEEQDVGTREEHKGDERPAESFATDPKSESSTQEVAGEDEKEKHRGHGQGQEERRVRESDDREEQGMADRTSDFENESSEEEVGEEQDVGTREEHKGDERPAETFATDPKSESSRQEVVGRMRGGSIDSESESSDDSIAQEEVVELQHPTEHKVEEDESHTGICVTDRLHASPASEDHSSESKSSTGELRASFFG